jgi:NTE family protein
VSDFEAPDVLVLGGGGILGEAWMSAVLAGLREEAGFDPRECDGYVGTSAGSIVAAALVAGIDPRERLGRLPEPPAVTDDGEAPGGPGLVGRALEAGVTAGSAVAAPLVALGLRATEPGGALLRREALRRVPAGRRSLERLGRELDRAGAGWDGRLQVSAVEVDSGRRVMFGAPGAPEVSVGEAVQASCAIPGVFRPLVVDGHRYVDGGVWSPTNLDRAPAGRGTRVLCLNPTGAMRPGRGAPFGAVGPVSRGLAAIEALTLERRGARVSTVAPDAASQAALGPNLMDPGPRSRVIAAGLAQGRALA